VIAGSNFMHTKIQYKSGYKYQLYHDYILLTDIKGHYAVVPRFIELYHDGALVVHSGYAWDGPSGPTIDTKSFMRGSLVHDALYQLMRERLIPQTCRKQADIELHKICLEDGMNKFRAWYVYHAVRLFAASAASGDKQKEIITAP